MFSPAIRRHPDWSPVVAHLNNVNGIKETRLDGHDFALRMAEDCSYRFLLLSPSDLKRPEELRPRLEWLNMLQGGQDVGIAFLLGPGGDISGMMELQNLLYTNRLSIQIIPITSPVGFIDAMNAFADGLKAAEHWQTQSRPPHPLRDLIPYCTPMENLKPHTANVLSDICMGFRDLVDKQSSQAGTTLLLERLGKKEGQEVVTFWRKEC